MLVGTPRRDCPKTPAPEVRMAVFPSPQPSPLGRGCPEACSWRIPEALFCKGAADAISLFYFAKGMQEWFTRAGEQVARGGETARAILPVRAMQNQHS